MLLSCCLLLGILAVPAAAASVSTEAELRSLLDTLAEEFPGTNGTTKNDVLSYVQEKLPNAAVWATNGNYSFKQRLATETAAGFVNMGIGVTFDGVTVEQYVFRATIPALNTSPDATNLAADKALMEAAFKAFTPTAKTTGDELLAAVNTAATHGTKAAWGSNYSYKAPTATAQGSISGDIILTLGAQQERLTTTEPYWPELEIRINFDSPDDVYGFGGFGEDLKMMCQVLKSATRKEQVIL